MSARSTPGSPTWTATAGPCFPCSSAPMERPPRRFGGEAGAFSSWPAPSCSGSTTVSSGGSATTYSSGRLDLKHVRRRAPLVMFPTVFRHEFLRLVHVAAAHPTHDASPSDSWRKGPVLTRSGLSRAVSTERKDSLQRPQRRGLLLSPFATDRSIGSDEVSDRCVPVAAPGAGGR